MNTNTNNQNGIRQDNNSSISLSQRLKMANENLTSRFTGENVGDLSNEVSKFKEEISNWYRLNKKAFITERDALDVLINKAFKGTAQSEVLEHQDDKGKFTTLKQLLAYLTQHYNNDERYKTLKSKFQQWQRPQGFHLSKLVSTLKKEKKNMKKN